MRNALVASTSTGCQCRIWMQVMSRLEVEQSIHPRYFMYYDKKQLDENLDSFLSSIDGEVFFHNELDAFKGRGFYSAEKVNVLDAKLLENIAQYELLALKMLDRLDPLSDSFSFTNRQYFFRDVLLKSLDIIDELKIDIFICPDVPHRFFDYVFLVACRIKNIEFICFDMVPFGDSSVIIDSVDDFPRLSIKEEVSPKICDAVNDKLCSVRGVSSNYKLWYMEEQKKHSDKRLLKALKILMDRMKNWKVLNPVLVYKKIFGKTVWAFYTKKGCMPKDTEFSLFELFFIHRKINKKLSIYSSLYEEKISQLNFRSEKFVLVALHFQPEATTSPTGGVFVDQLLIIEMLDRILPKDIKIVVKEHKSQFSNALESPSAGRSEIFYQRLQEFSSRVLQVSVDIKSFDLIDNAIATVTVSGTIGFESLARDKPVLCFGRSWYEHCPGAFRVKHASDLKRAWNIITSDGYFVDKEKVDSYINGVSQHFIWAKHSGVFRSISVRSTEESVENIVSGINDFFRRGV